MNQLRPRGGNDPWYAPDRDLAHIYAPLMAAAVAGLDEKNWDTEMSRLLALHGISEKKLGDAVGALMAAHEVFMSSEVLPGGARTALERGGWSQIPYVARQMLMARVGQMVMGVFFRGLRELQRPGEVPANSEAIARFVATGYEVMQNLRGNRLVPSAEVAVTQTVASLTNLLGMTQRALKESQTLVGEANQRYAELKRHTDATISSLTAECADLTKQLHGSLLWKLLSVVRGLTQKCTSRLFRR